MTRIEKIKLALAAVKAVFDGPPAPAPAAPASTSTAVVFSWPVDGGSTVYVDCTSDGIPGIDQSDMVYTDPALTQPYPDGTYTVTGTQFGFTVASGAVTTVTDAAGTGPGVPLEQSGQAAPTDLAKPPVPPVAKPVVPAAPPAPAPVTQMSKLDMTPEGMAAMFAAFSTGTPEDRIANLELVCKALMEYNFGWQIREAQQKLTADEAINIYKVDLVNAQSQLDGAKTQLAKQDTKLTQLFALVEAIAEIPSADPKTLTGPRKDVFDKVNKKEERLQAIADAISASKKK